MNLSNSQKRYLRGLTHDINPVVMVGDKGLSETVLSEIELALDRHELIKVKLRSDKANRKLWIDQIVTQFKAIKIHSIGQVACFFRRNPERPVVELPKK